MCHVPHRFVRAATHAIWTGVQTGALHADGRRGAGGGLRVLRVKVLLIWPPPDADRTITTDWPDGEPVGALGRYSPGECVGTEQRRVEGRPDPKHVSTSQVERRNLNPRMGMRRFARLTNAFSKKAEPHYWMVCLYTAFHNFVRIHKTLRCTPAMVAGLTKTLLSTDDLVAMIDAQVVAPKRPRVYKVRNSN